VNKSKQGFASLPPERRSEIAGMGGRAAHAQGAAHEFTPEEAKAAGTKGGVAVSKNRKHMVEIGRKGGQARTKKAAE
jgi:general stress protein YciG